MSTILKNVIRKARKKHRCNGCYEFILTSDIYRDLVFVEDVISSFKLCYKCSYLWSNERKYDELDFNEWSEGDIAEYHYLLPESLPKLIKESTND